MAEPTLYLFDGFNLLHAGGFGSPEELRDLLASWVAAKGARGVLVFDGHGADERHGPLEGRWAEDRDAFSDFAMHVDGGGHPQPRRDGAVNAAHRLHRMERALPSYASRSEASTLTAVKRRRRPRGARLGQAPT